MAWPEFKKIACYAKVHTHKRMYVTPYFVLPEKKNPFTKLKTLKGSNDDSINHLSVIQSNEGIIVVPKSVT